jgi:hypothetical protein
MIYGTLPLVNFKIINQVILSLFSSLRSTVTWFGRGAGAYTCNANCSFAGLVDVSTEIALVGRVGCPQAVLVLGHLALIPGKTSWYAQ